MANQDSSQYVLRWNEILSQLEFAAGNIWVPTGVGLVEGINQLTGDVTAGPGTGSQVATVHSASGAFLVNGAVQPTILSAEVINESAAHTALSITGTAVDTSNSTDGIAMYLMHNGTNNRQLGFIDSGTSLTGTEPVIRFVLNSTAPAIDVFDANLAGAGTVPLTLGNSTNGIISAGLLTTPTIKITTTPTAGYVLTTDSSGNGTWQTTAGTYLPLAGGTMTGSIVLGKSLTYPITTKNSSNIATAVDSSLFTHILVDVDGAITIPGPTNPQQGRTVTFVLEQDVTGHTVTFSTGAGNFAFGTTIPSFTASGASKTDYVGAIWNADAGVWHIVSVSQGF